MLLCRSREEKSALFLHGSSTGFWSTGQLSNGLHIRMERLAAHLWFTPTQSETFPFISNHTLFSPNQDCGRCRSFKRSKQLYNSWHCSKTEHQLAVKVKAFAWTQNCFFFCFFLFWKSGVSFKSNWHTNIWRHLRQSTFKFGYDWFRRCLFPWLGFVYLINDFVFLFLFFFFCTRLRFRPVSTAETAARAPIDRVCVW